jgi:hypothetical protein
MCASNVSNLPTKITAKDRERQYPGILHESGGKLFCTACNIVVEHKHKSSTDYRQTTGQIIMTQAVAPQLSSQLFVKAHATTF